MKIFISWSQDRSLKFAEALKEFLQVSIQEVKPFLSSGGGSGGGIASGEQWFPKIMNNLADTSQGIICLTPENKDAPWVMFESGAIAKGLETNRVHIILVGMRPHEVGPPLSQFHMVNANEAGIKTLITDINEHLINKLPTNILEKAFERNWPEFEQRIQAIEHQKVPSAKAKRSSDDIMLEILNSVRTFDTRLRKIEERELESTVFFSAKHGAIPPMPDEMNDSDIYNFFWKYGIAPFSDKAARIMTKNGYDDYHIRKFQKWASKYWEISNDPGEQ